MNFSLHDASSGGSQVGSTVSKTGISVVEGLFTTQLDFTVANAFEGNARWLEIAVKCTSDGSFTTLTPRQPLTPVPYAIYAQNVGEVDTSAIADSTIAAVDIATDAVETAEILDGTIVNADISGTAAIDSTKINTGVVSNAEFNFLDGVTSAIQTQLDLKGTGDVTLIGTETLTNKTLTSPTVNTPTVAGGTVNGSVIGGTTPAAGTFTSLTGESATLTLGKTGTAGVGNIVLHDNQVGDDFTTTLKAADDVDVNVTFTLPAAVGTNGQILTTDASGNLSWVGGAATRIIWVATSEANFNSIQAALTAVSDGDTDDGYTDASATNQYVIKVAPGTYNEQVTMVEYVDIEGSGEGVTTIKYTGSGTGPLTDNSSATVIGANHAELRFLTIESASSNYATAIYNDGTSPKITHVTATASGGSNTNRGVYNSSSSPTMTNVTATGSGGTNSYGVHNNNSSSPTMTNVTALGGTNSFGVLNNSSSPTMTNVIATASGGTNNFGVQNKDSSPTIRNSSLIGGSNSIKNNGTNTVKVANTMLDGDLVGGTFICFNNYDAGFAAKTCPSPP